MGPALVLALVGLGWMVARPGRQRRLAAEIIVICAALLVPVGAFHQWWGGMAAVGRPLVAALPVLAVPAAWLYERAHGRQPLRAACWMLIAASVAMVVTLATAQQGLLLVGERDGTSRLLSWWSPSWPLAAVAPSYVAQPPWLATIETLVWIAALAVGFGLLIRFSTVTAPGRAALVAFGTATSALAAATVAVPLVPGRGELHDGSLSERAESRLLHDFDARRRPLGIVFSPFRLVDAMQVASMVHFTAGPELREERTPVPLLYRARWSLPAGQYRLELMLPDSSRRLSGELGLQLGQHGEPIERWNLDAVGRWSTTIDLPIDVRFVGLRASDDLTALRPRVRLRPLRIIDVSDRLGGTEVQEARRVGSARLFFHDTASYPEPSGTWLRADSTTHISLALSDGLSRVMRLRAGAGATTLDIRAGAMRDTIALKPGEGRDVPLTSGASVQRLEISTRGGFVPAEVSPGSQDERRLSCWMEIVES
jgi:hypothetical protein